MRNDHLARSMAIGDRTDDMSRSMGNMDVILVAAGEFFEFHCQSLL